jgi:flagellar biosynthesis/type III secretory pathway protein FliH
MRSALTLRMPGAVRSVRVVSGEVVSAPASAPVSPPPPTKPALDAQWMQAQQAKVQQACLALESAAAQLNQARAEMLAEAEEQLLELAIGLAGKAMMQDIEAGRHRIEPLLKEALLRVQGRQDVVVYLHPEDLAQCLTEEGQPSELCNVKLQADEVVHRGQCLVETSQGAMISSFTDRMDDLADVIRSRDQ